MIFKIVGFALTGKLLIYLIQIFPPTHYLYRWKYLEKLFTCDLCLGVWVYSILNLLYFRVDVLDDKDEKV